MVLINHAAHWVLQLYGIVKVHLLIDKNGANYMSDVKIIVLEKEELLDAYDNFADPISSIDVGSAKVDVFLSKSDDKGINIVVSSLEKDILITVS